MQCDSSMPHTVGTARNASDLLHILFEVIFGYCGFFFLLFAKFSLNPTFTDATLVGLQSIA